MSVARSDQICDRMEHAAVGQLDVDAGQRRVLDDVPIGEHVVLAVPLDQDAGAGFVDRGIAITGPLFGLVFGVDVNDARLDQAHDPLQYAAVLFERGDISGHFGKQSFAGRLRVFRDVVRAERIARKPAAIAADRSANQGRRAVLIPLIEIGSFRNVAPNC